MKYSLLYKQNIYMIHKYKGINIENYNFRIFKLFNIYLMYFIKVIKSINHYKLDCSKKNLKN